MRNPALFLTCAAAVAAAISPIGAGSAAGTPSGGGGEIRAPLTRMLRGCDSRIMENLWWGTMGGGTGEAIFRTSGNTVSAEIQFTDTRIRSLGTHYDVVLIQTPRSAASPCGPGAAGVATAGMDTDGSGRATVTISDTLHPGTTGAFVNITKPSGRSQDPMEYYTTSFVPKV